MILAIKEYLCEAKNLVTTRHVITFCPYGRRTVFLERSEESFSSRTCNCFATVEPVILERSEESK